MNDNQIEFPFYYNEIEDENYIDSFYKWCVVNKMNYLIDEWDYDKNNGLTPKDITPNNGKKYWWIVHYDDPITKKHFDFSWQATTGHRMRGDICPYLCNPPQKILDGFNDIATTDPNVVEEWAEENKERGLFINNISRGSTKKALWKCKIHGTYEQVISTHVAQGSGCPYCAGKKVLAGVNDLKTIYPELAKEWDYEKNEIGPNEITPHADKKKYWWICSQGHSYLATPNARTGYSKTGCPICANKIVLEGFNDLASKRPDLLKEWDYEKNTILPTQVAEKSNKVVWWICKYGHEYKDAVCTKTMYNIICPICTRERQISFSEKAIFYYVKQVFSDATENEKLSCLGGKEVDIFIPSLKVGIEYDGSFWHRDVNRDLIKDEKCKNGRVELIRIRENDCPRYDSDSYKIYYDSKFKNNSLTEAINELLKFIIKRNNTNKTIDVDVDRDYSIILDKYVTGEKENNLSKRPDLIKEWDYEKNGKIKPEFVSLYSNKKVWWKCPKCNQSYLMMVNNRTGSKNSNCPICASKRVVTGINDLATTDPKLIKEWDYSKNTLDPTKITRGNSNKAWWICKKGHSWQSVIYSRTTMGCGCPVCGHQVVGDKNSFADLYPELLKEWDYNRNERDPYTILPNSNLKFWWKCSKCGYEYEQCASDRTNRKRGCPLCSHQVLVPGTNDLATQFPEIAKEWNYDKNILKPTEVSGGTNKKYWWKCSKCGYEWECVVASRTKRGSKCPVCRTKKEA